MRVFNNTITDSIVADINIVHSSNNYIIANTLFDTFMHGSGVLVDGSNFTVISGNNITIPYGGSAGIDLRVCSNNTIYNNWFNCSGFSVAADSASDNLIFHNNFVGNNSVKFYPPTNNKWFLDWPVGGNFWSSHTSPDVKSGRYQNEPGSDGICDNYYTIAEGVIDAYPLMGPCNRFEVRFGPLSLPNRRFQS